VKIASQVLALDSQDAVVSAHVAALEEVLEDGVVLEHAEASVEALEVVAEELTLVEDTKELQVEATREVHLLSLLYPTPSLITRLLEPREVK
jgi:hypothetical protein